jgi:hypothetical protein
MTTPAAPCSICQGQQRDASTIATTVTYVHVPLPRLWHQEPKFRFTITGMLLLALALWYLGESLMCSLYCRPTHCSSGKPCNWSPDDPLWGYSIPVKLDQWIAGGQGRAWAAGRVPDVADWLADLWDTATGTDITKVDTSSYGWSQNRQHRRRLQKKGLLKPLVHDAEDRSKLDAARLAKDMSHDLGENDSMSRDERLE